MRNLIFKLSIAVAVFLGIAPPTSATTSCSGFVSGLPPLAGGVCADAVFSRIGPGSETLFGADHGPTAAAFDGATLFPGAPPPNVGAFSSASTLSFDGPAAAAESLSVKITGDISVEPGTESYGFLELAGGGSNRTVFTPTKPGGGPLPIYIDWTDTFTITDPTDNASSGTVVAGRSFVLSGPGGFIMAESGMAELETEFSLDPSLFGAFAGEAVVSDCPAPGCKRIEYSGMFMTTVVSGDILTLDTTAFGDIFSDGFESGDTSAWSYSSPDSTVFTVSSADPTVSFAVVVPLPPAAWLFACGVLSLAGYRKRNK